MSLFPKVLVSRHELVRGISSALAIGALAAAALIGISAEALNAQSGGRELSRVEFRVHAQLPEVVILRDQQIVSEQALASGREVVLSVRVGGNVALRIEALPQAAEAVAAQVLDARGQWMELDRAIIVAREARGGLREVRVQVRLADGADLPILRAVVDR
jgi:hypothetical protein